MEKENFERSSFTIMDNGATNYCRFLDGDDQGIVNIITEYKDSLILFLNTYVQNIYIAEELTEDVFFTLVTKKPKYSANHSFKTWLFTIGRNRAINSLRFRSKIISLDQVDFLSLQKDTCTIEGAYIKKEEKILLHKCINKLLPQYATVLYLYYFEEFTVDEIGKIIKKKNKQVSNLIYRGKNALKELLLKEGFEYENL